jgi:endonuclease YncB( thermonuclease family)
MRVLLLLVVVAAPALAGHKKGPPKEHHEAKGAIVLNGTRTEVVWTDGDSFRVKDGPFKGRGTRLQGYDTLEAYGPVHRWGTWTAAELYALAKASSQVAAAQVWACTTDGKEDSYHRLLILCPELTRDIVRQGHGLAYAVEGQHAEPEVLEAQREAQAAGRGMWAKGVVKGVITSLHSLGEDDSASDAAYNRVVDTRTGQALRRKHQKEYAVCEEVCEETDGETSCMVYVPFRQRYHHQPECLKAAP